MGTRRKVAGSVAEGKKKRAVKKISAESRQEVSSCLLPEWKAHLDMYKELRALRFSTPQEFAAATKLLWTDRFRALPCDLAPYRTIIVPAEAVAYFQETVTFTETPVLSPDDLPPEELAELRREQGPY